MDFIGHWVKVVTGTKHSNRIQSKEVNNEVRFPRIFSRIKLDFIWTPFLDMNGRRNNIYFIILF